MADERNQLRAGRIVLKESRIRRRGARGGGGGGGTGIINDDGWHYLGEDGEPELENSFIAVGTIKPGFRKVGDYVEISGLFLGAANTVIFTLPVGYRPDTSYRMFGVVVDISVGGAVNMFDGLLVGTDGTVSSGGNTGGYTLPLWSVVAGVFFPLIAPEAP